MEISDKFTVEDIHKIREDNWEKTKHLSPEELIEETRKAAAPGWARIEELREKKRLNNQSERSG